MITIVKYDYTDRKKVADLFFYERALVELELNEEQRQALADGDGCDLSVNLINRFQEEYNITSINDIIEVRKMVIFSSVYGDFSTDCDFVYKFQKILLKYN